MKPAIPCTALLLAALLSIGWTTGAGAAAALPAIGPIALEVDLSDAPRKLFHARISMPVKPGPLTLYYPKWIPGEHAPSGPLGNVAGIRFTANGRTLDWRRDLVNMYAIHVDIPQGASTLDAAFDFLSPDGGGQFGQSVSATPKIVDLEWNQVLLYPAGYASRDITFEPSVKLPQGWRYGTALEPAGTRGDGIHFQSVSLNNLVDSPLIAGEYFRQVDLAPGARVPVYLDMVADGPENLAMTPQQIGHFRDLVKQAYALFDSHHYGAYHFLLTLSDNTGHFGLEHHQSSDDRTWADFFTKADTALVGATLLPHEYVHSWNGKFRRPGDLWTLDFNSVPEKDDLLWVYEGLTQYWGMMLTARSGLWTAQDYRDAMALTAADMDHRPGRTWRPLQDTADEASILYYVPGAWANWRRGVDFYPEGALLWLDVDTKLRELSHGRRSLNDFARLFYGMDNGSYVTRTYGFDDVVASLNRVQPYDWARFLRERLDTTRYHAPLGGITRGGYRLAYTDTPSTYFKANDKLRKISNQMYSVGLLISTDAASKGLIQDVLWDGPAFKAGIGAGMQLVAVDGRAFTPEVLNEAITQAEGSAAPIQLLVKNLEYYRTYAVDYHGGLRYPQLERVPGTPDYLDRIIAPLKPKTF
ncbi:MAG: M61 family metallopeptidase [Gammaproteobacteria bacterium]|nr:M61 family metallopeptidase [Gammaproteobacteria bacterium]